MNAPLTAWISGIGLIAPGLPDWATAAAVLREHSAEITAYRATLQASWRFEILLIDDGSVDGAGVRVLRSTSGTQPTGSLLLLALSGPVPPGRFPVVRAESWRDGGGTLELQSFNHSWGPIGAVAAATLGAKDKVEFVPSNLTKPCPELGMFDLIMLRNVLIYFDLATKQLVLKHVLERLKPGGWLMVGHSESLQGLPLGLEQVAPSIYRKHAR